MTLAKTSRSCHNEYRVPRGLRPRALRPRGNASRNPRARFFYATEDLEGFTEASIADVRFYCNTSFHSRKVHFKTSDSFVTGLAFDPSQVGNSASFWNSGFTVLEGHTGYLPYDVNGAYNENNNAVDGGWDGGFWSFPFYQNVDGRYFWTMRGINQAYWACDDDYDANGAAYTTLHQVWVRMAS